MAAKKLRRVSKIGDERDTWGWEWRELHPPGKPSDHWSDNGLRCWGNQWYQVVLYVRPPFPDAGFPMPLAQLSIKRWDREQIVEWRDFQRIKDDILGTHVEAVQLFPSSERILDTANQYHLWALPVGNVYPVGYFDGRVTDADPGKKEEFAAYEREHSKNPGSGSYVGSKQAERKSHHTDEGLPPVGLAGDWWSAFGWSSEEDLEPEGEANVG
jgi:hypothetical protein